MADLWAHHKLEVLLSAAVLVCVAFFPCGAAVADAAGALGGWGTSLGLAFHNASILAYALKYAREIWVAVHTGFIHTLVLLKRWLGK